MAALPCHELYKYRLPLKTTTKKNTILKLQEWCFHA